jgi:hypothetical protein
LDGSEWRGWYATAMTIGLLSFCIDFALRGRRKRGLLDKEREAPRHGQSTV